MRRVDDRWTIARHVARVLGIPDEFAGIPTSRWRRWWQRHVTRRP